MQLIKRTTGYKLSPQALEVEAEQLTSFNEPHVTLTYEDGPHIYTYEGKRLTSVTGYIKKFFKPFDSDTIVKACASSWEVDPQAVKDLWDSNTSVSGKFGTAIHEALEHYEKFKDFGRVVSDKRENKENYALPKHPLLKNIILDFIAINKVEGKVLTEVMVTDIESGLCGTADRIVIIDLDKKICRIGDYKINVDSEKKDSNCKPFPPFDMLPANKIAKYQLQMSIYANMLQKSGWTVTGLDVYIYENEWKHFELPVLKVID